MKRTLTALSIICMVVIVISLPMLAVHAAPAIQDAPPTVDWSGLVMKILAYAIPLLVASLTAWAVASARYWWGKLAIERPDIMDLITQAAAYATPIVEQLRKNGTIPDITTAKRKAVELARVWLIMKGVNAQTQEKYLRMIEDAIEGAVHELGKGKETTVITLDSIFNPPQGK